MCVHVIQSPEKIWVCTLAFFFQIGDSDRKKKGLYFIHIGHLWSSIQLNQGTPNPGTAGAREPMHAFGVKAIVPEAGRRGSHPPAHPIFSTGCAGFCSWLLTCRR